MTLTKFTFIAVSEGFQQSEIKRADQAVLDGYMVDL